jgi:cytoskeleton protein RodZ
MSEADGAAAAPAETAVAGGTTSLRPGRALAEARAARNLTLAEVAQQLKLSATQVEALEADAYDRLPGPVFVRGFVRNYARLLELDAEALVGMIELPHVSSPASAAIPMSRNIPFPEQGRTNWMPYAAVLVLVIGAIVLFEIFFSASPAVVVSAVTPKPAVEPVVVQPAPPAKEAAPATPQAEVVVTAVVAEPVTSPALEKALEKAPAQPQPGMAELHFVFKTDSWVEVRDRNERILFSQLNAAGTEHRMQGRRPLSLVIGNARSVQLNYNGKLFDLTPHTRVDVARFTLE